MSWALFAKEALRRGETVQVKPHGHSMKGKVNDGDLVTLEPVAPEALSVGDIVLVRVHGRDYLHLVKAIDKGRFQIGNNRGGINGWVGPNGLYGWVGPNGLYGWVGPNGLYGKAVKVQAPA